MLWGKPQEILSQAFGTETDYEVGSRGVKCRLLVPITVTGNRSFYIFPPIIIYHFMKAYFENCWNLLDNEFLNNTDQLSTTDIKPG